MIRDLRSAVIAGLFIGIGVSTVSCRQTNAELRAAADALSRAADECLYDVRDRNLTWEQSSHCGSLSALASSYIALGGFQNENAEVRLVADRARTTAWMARATSLAGGRFLSVF